MPKIGLKGFSGLRAFPVTENKEDTYKVGAPFTVPNAVSCTIDDQKSDYELPADDGIYDEGSEYKSTTLVITVQELSLEVLAKLTGAKYDAETKVYSESSIDIAPEIALSFRALRRDGQHRMFKYFVGKLTQYKADHTTKGQSADGQPYTLTFKMYERACDYKVRDKKDTETAADLSWLETIDSVEAT